MMASAGPQPGPRSVADLDLTGLVALLWMRRWMVFGITSLFIVAYGAVAFLTPKVYSGKTVFVSAHRPGAGDSPLRGLGGLAAALDAGGMSMGESAKVQEALALLLSRHFIGEFITEQNLAPALMPERWDAGKRAWRDGRPPTTGEASERFFDRLEYARDKRTLLYFVKIEWTDPVVAARLANGLVDKVNAEMRARAIAEGTASLKELERELEVTKEIESRLAIARLMASELSEKMFAEVTAEYAFRVVDRAVPADLRDNDRPNKPLLLVLGGIVGGFVGVVTVFLRENLQLSRARKAGFEQTTRPRN